MDAGGGQNVFGLLRDIADPSLAGEDPKSRFPISPGWEVSIIAVTFREHGSATHAWQNRSCTVAGRTPALLPTMYLSGRGGRSQDDGEGVEFGTPAQSQPPRGSAAGKT